MSSRPQVQVTYEAPRFRPAPRTVVRAAATTHALSEFRQEMIGPGHGGMTACQLKQARERAYQESLRTKLNENRSEIDELLKGHNTDQLLKDMESWINSFDESDTEFIGGKFSDFITAIPAFAIAYRVNHWTVPRNVACVVQGRLKEIMQWFGTAIDTEVVFGNFCNGFAWLYTNMYDFLVEIMGLLPSVPVNEWFEWVGKQGEGKDGVFWWIAKFVAGIPNILSMTKVVVRVVFNTAAFAGKEAANAAMSEDPANTTRLIVLFGIFVLITSKILPNVTMGVIPGPAAIFRTIIGNLRNLAGKSPLATIVGISITVPETTNLCLSIGLCILIKRILLRTISRSAHEHEE